jgi:hypothetical protein
MKLLNKYNNGNYTVTIFDDGTKVRENKLDNFAPEFPESIDYKITNYCNMGCEMCHEDSGITGTHGDILSHKFIDTLHPYTELAIGGGNPLDHPGLIEFLSKLKSRHIIANITVNVGALKTQYELLKSLSDDGLVNGIGISINSNSLYDMYKEQIELLPNVVLHIVVGYVVCNAIMELPCKSKVLLLGYKKLRRGADMYGRFGNIIDNNIQKTKEMLPDIISRFNVVSFDNLSIEQLGVKDYFTAHNMNWDNFYMGNDGQFTMYIDGAKEEYAVSSVSPNRYGLLNNITDMFNIIRRN